jgi:hypothetical protein
METIKFGLLLSIIPFTLIFFVVAIWWALVDMSLRKITGAKRVIWTLLTVLFPPFGSIAYNYMVRMKDEKKEEEVAHFAAVAAHK